MSYLTAARITCIDGMKPKRHSTIGSGTRHSSVDHDVVRRHIRAKKNMFQLGCLPDSIGFTGEDYDREG